MVNKILSTPLFSVSDVIPEHENTALPSIELGKPPEDYLREGMMYNGPPQDRNNSFTPPMYVDSLSLKERSPSMLTSDTSNLNDDSISSALNSFIGYAAFTRGRNDDQGTVRSGMTSGVFDTLSYSESQSSMLGSQTTTPKKDKHGSGERDTVNKSKTMDSSVKDITGLKVVNHLSKVSPRDKDAARSGEGRTFKSVVSSSASMLKDKKAKPKQERVPNPNQSRKKPQQPKHDANISVVSCYVISKDRDSIYNKLFVGAQSNISFLMNSGKMMSYRSRKTMSDPKESYGPANAAKSRHPEYQTLMTLDGVKSIDTSRLLPFRSRNPNDRKGNQSSTVSLVNKGLANVAILKFQSNCVNYLDVNPDFGWRRLVEERCLSSPATNNTNHPAKNSQPPGQPTYMYYRETKMTTHSMGIGDLAINVSCRLLILSLAQGLMAYKDVPRYIKDLVKLQYDDWEEPKKQENMESDTGEPCRRGLYFKSSFLGLYTPSSLGYVLRSAAYKESILKSKRSHMWQIKKLLKKDKQSTSPESMEPSVYDFIPIPNYGWKLMDKPLLDKISQGIAPPTPSKCKFFRALCRIFKRGGRTNDDSSSYSNAVLCKIKPPHIEDKRTFLHADVGSIAMNISEQLYRLEIRQVSREKLPKSTFGFQMISHDVAQSPCGRKFKLIPEELILNAATLIHELYITQPCLML